MGKKLTIEFIRAEFAKEGYELLTKVYKNAHQKLDYICPKGHKHHMRWNNWGQGDRCSYCNGNAKLTIEFIREEFAKEGYILLTKIYKNARQKLDYICPKGHKYFISWNNWKAGRRCPYCSNCIKLTIKFICKEFAKEGYTLLTKVYEGAHQKLEYICPRGHKHSISWSGWQRGQRCLYCSGKIKLTIEFIRKEFAKEGYTLLTETYENSRQKLNYICSRGHRYFITWAHWQQGQRCLYCNGKVKLTIEFIRKEFAKEGYTLLTKVYRNSKQKLEYICPKGHRYLISWGKWQQGQRCPFCNSNGVSKWEKVIKKFLDKSKVDYIPNDRTQLINPNTDCKLELDIWLPDLNKAVECNGIYWHKNRQHIDLLKKQLCKDQGINLLVVTDEEWNEDIDKCKRKLISFVKAGA